MEADSPAPKAQRAKHQQSRSAANASPVRPNNAQVTHQKNRKYSKNLQPTQNKAPAPAWENAVVSDPGDGSFDADGKFVSRSRQALADQECATSATSQKTRQKPSKDEQANGFKPTSGQRSASGQFEPKSAAAQTATPAKQAYAGPTFHASPAASALPMPKFLSKSVPPTAASSETSLQARLEQEPGSEKSSATESPPPVDSKRMAPFLQREQSPLDLFFKADREEKARKASQASPATPNGKPELSHVQSAPPQPQGGNNLPPLYGANQRHHSRNASTRSNGEMFALELDGASAQPRQLKLPQKPQLSAHELSASAPPVNRQAQYDSLRDFLNATVLNSSPSPRLLPRPNRVPSGYSSDQQGGSPVYRKHPQTRSNSGPSTPAAQTHQDTNFGSLHYGNRNLSPMFQAARNDGSKRSSLRREMPSSPTANGAAELPASHAPSYGGNLAPRAPQQPSQSNLASIYGNGIQPSNHTPAPHRSMSVGTASPSSNVQTMEDDLRRILKLTVAENNSSVHGTSH